MRKLHDIHTSSSRSRKNQNSSSTNNNNNSSNNTNNGGSSYPQTSLPLSPPSAASHNIVGLNHHMHPFTSLQQQHQRITAGDYASSFMMPTARQRIDSSPFIAKVF
jgi:hypothetical protein